MAWVCARIAIAELVVEPSLHRQPDEVSPPAPRRVWPASRPKPMPTFSSNDRSRWATVRALVDQGTFVIGEGTFDPESGRFRGGRGYEKGIIAEDGWGTIDKMMDPATGRFYSTKPPLLTILAAAQYFLLKQLFGWSITENPELVVKTILILTNALPLLVYLGLLRRVVEQFGRTDWGQVFTFTAGCLGTFVTTFANTLNNHVPAAVVTLSLVSIVLSDVSGWSIRRIVAIGFLAGLLICFELPAAMFSVWIAAIVIRSTGRRALLWGLVGASIPLATMFVVNRLAIGEFLPAYSKLNSPWYQYPGSHWLPPPPGEVKHGIDFARFHESKWIYIFHFLLGHHGWFSLTPIWLFSLVSLFRPRWVRWPWPNSFHFGIIIVSAVVIGFYLVRTDNYGGWTSGPRWLIWLTPLWLLPLLPVADRASASPRQRAIALGCLAVSVFSSCYPAINPWRHPWLYRLMENLGWVQY
jgi:hypothetical protein